MGTHLFFWTLFLTSVWQRGRTSGPTRKTDGARDRVVQSSVPGVHHPPDLCSPLCWRRTELVLLSGCILGTPTLQKVAARTMQLALELGALVDAGLLWRFPDSSPRAR